MRCSVLCFVQKLTLPQILLILSILSIIASTLSPLLAANTVTLALLFDKNFTEMALATGYHLLGVGVAGFLFVASARVWGKRHLYLLGSCISELILWALKGRSKTSFGSKRADFPPDICLPMQPPFLMRKADSEICVGTILIIISSTWGGATRTNYKSLLWARIIQGVGLAPFEALVNASVGDLYFIHVCPILVTECKYRTIS